MFNPNIAIDDNITRHILTLWFGVRPELPNQSVTVDNPEMRLNNQLSLTRKIHFVALKVKFVSLKVGYVRTGHLEFKLPTNTDSK